MKSLEEIRTVKQEVEPALLTLPGVTGVSIGFKSIGGEVTDQLAIIVYVDKKEDVPEENAIPKEIQGVPTDVVEARFTLGSTQDVT
jgi:hypothetical protein